MRIRIATRRSPLAVWQADHVADLLRAVRPEAEIELVPVDTKADLDLTRTIDEIGGKGAFSKEVQNLVLEGRADIAVHSAKDLQALTPDGLTIAAYPERGTTHDCLIGSRLVDLAEGATVATGSNRRRALLLDIRPDLKIVGLRGNIATRLGRLGEFDAIVMAAVALERLGTNLGVPAPSVVEDLDPETFVPQVGQGALAVECRTDDVAVRDALSAIDHAPSRCIVGAEREFLIELGGDCELPAGANAKLGTDGKLTIRGILAEASGPLQRAEIVELPGANPGKALAQRLRSEDASEHGGQA